MSSPLLPVALVIVAMIGVTSGSAVAADAVPSATANTGAGPAGDAVKPAAPDAPSPAPSAPPEAAPPPSSAPLPAAPQPPAAAATVDLTAPPSAAAEKQPITRTWWFWTAIGAAVVGGVVAIYLVERTPSPPGCPVAMGYVCPR